MRRTVLQPRNESIGQHHNPDNPYQADAADEVGVLQFADVLLHTGKGKSRGIGNLRHCNVWHRLHNRQYFLATFLVTFLVGRLIRLTLYLESPQNLVEHEVDERPALAGVGYSD